MKVKDFGNFELSPMYQVCKNKCFFCFLGSHIGSIECVLEHRTTAAAVDSNVLCNFLNKYPHQRDHLHVLTSFGPLPTYPIVFNSKLPGKRALIIQTALVQWQLIHLRFRVGDGNKNPHFQSFF